ncbi:MAG TPA: murein L,D-transpeptidase catalytic domain family protein [Ferruginibacter sp.]|nr:murein L,D-transpeptidase catalytic domain family protein [Ferruginibacter sp.]HMP20862.1 murein L,D-transpeptidase catalytic domain family protein [Ferruginibacter sp.]
MLYRLLLLPLFLLHTYQGNKHWTVSTSSQSATADSGHLRAIRLAKEAKIFCQKNKLDTGICLLIDMSLPPGTNRFFIMECSNNRIAASGLVAHGYGNSTALQPGFSNISGSHSTSLGRYKTGTAYMGRFGLAYKLHGLDSTNSNAYSRNVVLHAHPCIPDTPVLPETICMSQGCPTVSPAFLATLKNYFDQCNAGLLLWIYH